MPAGASRLGNAFDSHRGTTGLIPFLTAGYPSLDATLALMRDLESAGALALEIGIPFSDPIADGPDIQRASEDALRAGAGPRETLDLVRRYRAANGSLPVVLMTYSNPILKVGVDAFARGARDCGADAVLLTDLPPEESPEVWSAFDEAGLETIVLVAPTTPVSRLPSLIARCRGFVYCLSRTGITGGSEGYAGSLEERVESVRRHTTLPVAVGFGISSGEHARRLKGMVDAVVVGAAFMRAVGAGPDPGVSNRVTGLAREILSALQ
jgi:tryptophan synthase alpha chain